MFLKLFSRRSQFRKDFYKEEWDWRASARKNEVKKVKPNNHKNCDWRNDFLNACSEQRVSLKIMKNVRQLVSSDVVELRLDVDPPCWLLSSLTGEAFLRIVLSISCFATLNTRSQTLTITRLTAYPSGSKNRGLGHNKGGCSKGPWIGLTHNISLICIISTKTIEKN